MSVRCYFKHYNLEYFPIFREDFSERVVVELQNSMDLFTVISFMAIAVCG